MVPSVDKESNDAAKGEDVRTKAVLSPVACDLWRHVPWCATSGVGVVLPLGVSRKKLCQSKVSQLELEVRCAIAGRNSQNVVRLK